MNCKFYFWASYSSSVAGVYKMNGFMCHYVERLFKLVMCSTAELGRGIFVYTNNK